jgi:hypothetical protein
MFEGFRRIILLSPSRRVNNVKPRETPCHCHGGNLPSKQASEIGSVEAISARARYWGKNQDSSRATPY